MTGVDVSGVLLAGGTSERLGGDKAMAEVGGYPLLARVAAAARVCCDELVVVTADREAHAMALDGVGIPDDEVAWATDRRPGRGPLAGIEAGFGTATRPVCLLLACDLPFLRPAPLLGLLAELGDRRGRGSDLPRIVVPVVEGRRQPLCSACDRDAGDVATACLDGDEHSARAWLDRLEVREIPAELLPGAPRKGEPPWWTDVDDPEALARARAAAGGGGGSRAGGRRGDRSASRPAARLETERLVLDAAGPRFARQAFEAYASVPEVTRYLTFAPQSSVEETLEFLREAAASWDDAEAFTWAIRGRSAGGEPGPLVGMIGLEPLAEHDQIGYVLARERWGRGYMTEALRRVLDEATGPLGMEKVEITVHPENVASIRVLEKAGLERAGTLEGHHVFPNLGEAPSDCYVFRYRSPGGTDTSERESP